MTQDEYKEFVRLKEELTSLRAQLAGRDASLCKAKEATERLGDAIEPDEIAIKFELLEAALSSSSPCPHEEEAKRLRESLKDLEEEMNPHDIARAYENGRRRAGKEGG